MRIDGTDTSQLRESELAHFRSETVGFIFQQFHLVPHLNAVENVMLAQFFHSMTDEAGAMQALKSVGMDGSGNAFAGAAFGRGTAASRHREGVKNDPKIILADEPTGNLDAENQRVVFKILSDLHAAGRTIVMVTHDEKAGHLADRRVNLDHGRITETLVFSAEENQDFDEVLEHLWDRRETSEHMQSTDFTEMQWRRLIATMTRIGLVAVENGVEQFTPAGELRARNVIRRHRLAERLFIDVLSIRDEVEIESSACKFEHILSPDVTDRICTLLNHPAGMSMHGSPIPARANAVRKSGFWIILKSCKRTRCWHQIQSKASSRFDTLGN